MSAPLSAWQSIARMHLVKVETAIGTNFHPDIRDKVCWEMHPATMTKGRKHDMFDFRGTIDPKIRLCDIEVKHSYTVKEGKLRLTFCAETDLP